MPDGMDIKQRVKEFRAARNWPETDTPENLISALIVEAEETREDIETSGVIPPPPRYYKEHFYRDMQRYRERCGALSAHVADIGIYCLALCDNLGIDFEQAIVSKMKDLDYKHPTPLGQARRDLQERGVSAVRSIETDHLLELWGDDSISIDWGEVALRLSCLQKDEIFRCWSWSGIIAIARNCNGHDASGKSYASKVIESGIPAAIEEILTYPDPHCHGLTQDEITRGIEILRNNLEDKREDTSSARDMLRKIENNFGFLVTNHAQ